MVIFHIKHNCPVGLLLFFFTNLSLVHLEVDGVDESLAKVGQFFDSPDLVVEEGLQDDVEVVAVEVEALAYVFVLHFFSRHHFGADLAGLLGELSLLWNFCVRSRNVHSWGSSKASTEGV